MKVKKNGETIATIEDDGKVIEEIKDTDAIVTTLDNDGNVEVEVVSQGEVPAEEGPSFDPMAAVQAALSTEPTEFEKQIHLGLADRIQNAIERKRDDVAQAIFGTQNQEVETADNDAEEGDAEAEEVTPEAEDEETPTEE